MRSETWSAKRRKKRDIQKYYAKQAREIYLLQMREAIMRMTTEGVSDVEIARRLGQSTSTISRYRQQSRDQALLDSLNPDYAEFMKPELPREPGSYAKRGPGPGPHIPGSWKRPQSRKPPPLDALPWLASVGNGRGAGRPRSSAR